MTRRFLCAAVVASVLTVFASNGSAQSNYRLAPIGGRTTVLGGTGVVYGRDAAAAFLNPATAVLADDRRLAFSVNFYTVSLVKAPRWYQPGSVDRARFGDIDLGNATMTDIEFNALPSSLCLFFQVGDIPFLVAKTSAELRERQARVGFCFAAVQSQSWNFAAEGFSASSGDIVTRQAQSLSQSYTRYAAGPTYAMNIDDHLSVGASLHFSFASHRSLMTSTATTHRSSASPINSMFYAASRGDSFQLTGIVGATYALGRQKVGLAIEPPSLHVYGRGGANRHSNFDGTGRETSIVTADGSFASHTPLRVSLGTGLERDWGLFEFNASYWHSLASAYDAELEGFQVRVQDERVDDRPVTLNLSEPARGIVNLSAGAEVFLSPKLSVLSGVSTDFSAIPTGGLNGSLFNYYPHRTNRLTASAGFASHGAGGELVVGTELAYGWGDRIAVNSYQLPPDLGTTSQHSYQLLLTIAGATSLRAIKRAVDDVREVVVPKKKKPDGE
jgi:hypothetical protein